MLLTQENRHLCQFGGGEGVKTNRKNDVSTEILVNLGTNVVPMAILGIM